jgi:hypothetical protein
VITRYLNTYAEATLITPDTDPRCAQDLLPSAPELSAIRQVGIRIGSSLELDANPAQCDLP